MSLDPILDLPLFALSNHPEDVFTVREACEGIQIFGGIGSGKSSGSGKTIAKAFLNAGFGGLVLCAKKDERATWEAYAAETGRSQHLYIFDASGQHAFNFLNYEMRRPGAGAGLSDNVVRLFISLLEMVDRAKASGGEDQYWMRATRQLIRNAVDLCAIATGEVSLPTLYDIVMSAPYSADLVFDETWQQASLCYRLIARGESIEKDQWTELDFAATARYWLNEFPQLAERTRSIIVSMFTSMAENFLRRPFRQLFCSKTTIIPELSHKGGIIVMDLPVKEWGEAGRSAQVMFKYIWQQAVERRGIEEKPLPLFLWVDESQNFVTDYDMQFQATARSSRACTVYLTQNFPNYYAEFGGQKGKYRADSLVGNLQTKIFHANSDPETNKFAAETIGKSWQVRQGQSTSTGFMGATIGRSSQESFDYDAPPQEFTKLRKGGPHNNLEVEAVVFQNGRVWEANGRTFLKAVFRQDV